MQQLTFELHACNRQTNDHLPSCTCAMEKVRELQGKGGSLSIDDACFLLELLQEQIAPLLSLRALNNSDPLPQIKPAAQSLSAYQRKQESSSVSAYQRKQESSSGSNSIEKHFYVHKKLDHKSRNASLNLGSLEDFPPVSRTLQDHR